MKKNILVVIIIILGMVSVWYLSQPGFFSRGEVVNTDSESAVWRGYSNIDFGFSIKVPPGYIVDEAYRYEAFGSGHEITGVSFTVPETLVSGTNLSRDSYISVERLRDVACTPSDFLDRVTSGEKVMLDNNEYNFATSSGVGAGNLYEEGVYMRSIGQYCYGIRLFMHSTNIYNYDSGTVLGFDREMLIRTFQLMATTADFRP